MQFNNFSYWLASYKYPSQPGYFGQAPPLDYPPPPRRESEGPKKHKKINLPEKKGLTE